MLLDKEERSRVCRVHLVMAVFHHGSCALKRRIMISSE